MRRVGLIFGALAIASCASSTGSVRTEAPPTRAEWCEVSNGRLEALDGAPRTDQARVAETYVDKFDRLASAKANEIPADAIRLAAELADNMRSIVVRLKKGEEFSVIQNEADGPVAKMLDLGAQFDKASGTTC